MKLEIPKSQTAKLQTILFVAAVLSVVFFLARQGGLFRARPVAAQNSALSAQVTQCENLRKHGDPGTKACYQKLSTSNDVAIKAEGLWGLRDYQGRYCEASRVRALAR